MSSEWTIAVGLRRALAILLLRSLILLPFWAALLWLITPAANMLPLHWTQFMLLGALMTIPGGAIGATLARGLTERAGFVSVVLTAITVAFAWGVVLGGLHGSGLLRPLGDWQSLLAPGAAGGVATLWAVKNTLLDAD